jgi:hypothetical protein
MNPTLAAAHGLEWSGAFVGFDEQRRAYAAFFACSALTFAQRARCAIAIFRRAAADGLLLFAELPEAAADALGKTFLIFSQRAF